MLKRISFFIAFFLFFILNITLIFSYYKMFSLQNEQKRILSEIEHSKNRSANASGLVGAVLGVETDVNLADGRVANLKSFFRRHNSPLYNSAETIVAISDKHGFDYRLLPAIAMQESGVCRSIPSDSHNCWGYGIYGGKVLRFSSYDEAIEVVAEGIKTNYLNKGLTTPEAIMTKYTPSSKGSWANGVNFFINFLE